RRSMRPFLRLPALGRFVSSSYLELLTVDYQPLAATGISRFASANTVNSTCTRPIRISPALSELYPFVFFSLWVRSNQQRFLSNTSTIIIFDRLYILWFYV